MTQARALAIMKTGVNVYLTGSAGAGKTHTLREYIRWLEEHDIPVAITASTGIAATHMNGQTIHGWAGIGVREIITQADMELLEQRQYLWQRFQKARVLIIDEVSMLHAHRLDMVEKVCRRFKRNDLTFGGLQVILSGDFFQLPPVTKTGGSFISQEPSRPVQQEMFIDYDSGEIFEEEEEPQSDMVIYSKAWKMMKPVICYLTEQHRQDDAEFLEILNAVRKNAISEKHIDTIKSRMNAETITALPTKLYTHNVDVDAINLGELRKLASDEKEFVMMGHGSDALLLGLKKSCLAPEILRLKIGAEVMFTKNKYELGYVNGTRGFVAGFASNGEPIVEIYSNNKRVIVGAEDWSVEENGRVKASITQYPLRLAWAITIHKSQGMSLDSAEIDLSKTFAYGMGYVALSRVRTLSGVRLVGFKDDALSVDPKVLLVDQKMQDDSNANDELFAKLEGEGQDRLENEFILRMGGKVIKVEKPKKEEKIKKAKAPKKERKEGEPSWAERMAEIRKKHPNAYLPWSQDEDDALVLRFKAGATQEELVKDFGRQPGSIQMRLEKLGLVEPVEYKKKEE